MFDLEDNFVENESKPRVTGYGGSEGYIRIEGLTNEDLDKVIGCFGNGNCWVRVCDGELQFHPSWEKLPDPVIDPEMLPFWQRAEDFGPIQYELIRNGTLEEYSMPSIIITGLCGYHYTKDCYRTEAEKLQSWGFVCLRSQRGNDGKFWEMWYLPGLWMAKGKLGDTIKSKNLREKESFKAALDFLRENSLFGSLDVSVQRIAMVVDD